MSALLELKHVHKSFGSTKALVDMNFRLNKGEIHALVGENGAGKSTLINVMSGILAPDSGEICFEGKPIVIDNSPAGDAAGNSAKALGIAVIHQELLLCDTLSVTENIYLGELPGTRFVDWKAAKKNALEKIRILDDRIMPDDSAGNLTAAQRQIVEITRAISGNCRVLIMDEPTTSLTEADVEKLLRVVKKLRNQGISIIYISHKLEEVFEIADRITVIRDGHYIDTLEREETQRDEIIRMMVGREINHFYTRNNQPDVETIMDVSHLGGLIVKDASFSLRRGEILGFFGLIGAGRSELMNQLFGIDEHSGGEVLLDGKKLNIRKPWDAIDAGIAYVPEDRKVQGLFLRKGIGFNLTIANLKRVIGTLSVRKDVEDSSLADYRELLKIKMRSKDQVISALSGGNQQKVLISRWLFSDPKVLILDEPTKGIDIGAKADIYKLLDDLTARGMSVILVSSELPEILGMCDRVYIMHEHEIRGCLNKEELSQEAIMNLAVGGAAK